MNRFEFIFLHKINEFRTGMQVVANDNGIKVNNYCYDSMSRYMKYPCNIKYVPYKIAN